MNIAEIINIYNRTLIYKHVTYISCNVFKQYPGYAVAASLAALLWRSSQRATLLWRSSQSRFIAMAQQPEQLHCYGIADGVASLTQHLVFLHYYGVASRVQLHCYGVTSRVATLLRRSIQLSYSKQHIVCQIVRVYQRSKSIL